MEHELQPNATPSLQISTRRSQPSPLALTQQTQNSIIVAERSDLNLSPEEYTPAIPSVFGNLPAANADDVALVFAQLAACFPQMPSMFWGLATKQARAQCLSKERLEYISEKLLLTHKYPTLTMADIFSVDKSIHIIDWREYDSLRVPHKPLAKIHFDGKYYTVYLEDAERCGYQYTPVESAAERDEREKREREARWQAEYEEAVRNGGIDPSQPQNHDFDSLMAQLYAKTDLRAQNAKEKAKKAAQEKIRLQVIRQNMNLYRTDPDNACERIEQLIQDELQKQNLL